MFVVVGQVNDLLERQLVEEAVVLAETIAAVEASKNPSAAEEVGLLHIIYTSSAFA